MSIELKPLEKFDTILELVLYFKDEITCLKYLEHTTWDDIPRCPQCGMQDIYRYKNGKHFKCKQCKTEFTVKIGTIFESSKLPLVKWFMTMYLVATNTKGLSSYQLAKQIGVTQKTAWFMLHRIRKSMNQDGVELEGVVMSDESVVGGKNKNRHLDKKVDYSMCGLREYPDKTPVLGMIEKGKNGRVKTVVIDNTRFDEIKPVILNSLKYGSTWVTDEHFGENTMGKHFRRELVNHSKLQFVNDNGYTTNPIEGFWSHLKRTIIGIYHKVSKKHLQRYCDEITFRFNARNMRNGERLALLFSKINCRLKYRHLIR